jgi:fibronectin-binding autotransporter adhesin
MKNRANRARRGLYWAALGALFWPVVTAAADLQFINADGGDLNVAANFSPAAVPGASDTVQLLTTPTNVGPLTLYVASNQSIGNFTFGHYAQNIVDARLNGSTPYTLTLAQGQISFTDAITESPGTALTTVFFRAPIAGNTGLTKTGGGFLNLSGVNTYSGGTNIVGTGGGVSGGVSVSSDANLGAAGGAVNLSMNGTLRALSSFTSSRTFTVANGGRIESFGDLILNGDFGPGAGPTVGRFTGGSVQFGGTMNGGFSVANGNTVYLTGRSLGPIGLGGTLTLGRSSVGPNADALADTQSFTSYGGTLNVLAAAATRSDTTGSLILANGSTSLDLATSVAAGSQLTFSQLIRQNRSTLFARGRDMGAGTLAANRAIISFTNTAGLPVIGGGGTTATNDSIVPFVLGNANVTGGLSQISAVDAGFVALDANGLRPLVAADYATSLTAGATNNVRLSDGAFTQNAAVTINSLVVRDTQAGSGNSGVGGAGTLNITSGAIAAVSDLAGEELFIDNPINFGAAEGVIHTAPAVGGNSLLILRGAIAGTNGLTKAGNGDLYLENTNSSYSGTTTINAGVVAYTGSVGSGVNSAFGNSSSALVINAGVSGNEYVGLRATTPARSPDPSMSSRTTPPTRWRCWERSADSGRRSVARFRSRADS